MTTLVSKIVSVKKQNYIKVSLATFKQMGNELYIGKIDAADLVYIYVVNPVQYEDRVYGAADDSNEEFKEYYSMFLENRRKLQSEKSVKVDAQRLEEPDRVKKIKKFLEDNPYPVFPNSVIATCDLGEIPFVETEAEAFEYFDTKSFFSYFVSIGDEDCLYIPHKKHSLLIVDGQHRVAGLREYGIEKGRFDVLVTFMLGVERSNIANVFFTINGTQKPVSSSIISSLEGLYSVNVGPITYANAYIHILNEHKQSPYLGRIKMLGRIPVAKDEYINTDDKIEYNASFSVSLGFLTPLLVPLFSTSIPRGVLQPIFAWYTKNDQNAIAIKFMLSFFNAVRNCTKKYWDNPTDSVILKSASTAALFRVMNYTYVKLFKDELNMDPVSFGDVAISDLEFHLKGLELVDFSKEAMRGQSSGSSVTTITSEIVSKIAIFCNSDFESFLKDYKAQYVSVYKNWFIQNCIA